MFLALTALPVDAIVAEKSAEPTAAVPGEVSVIAWQWKAPSPMRDAVKAGPGAVVRIRDGVVAFDTDIGRARWHYRRPGAVTMQLFGAPDGGTVMVSFRSPFGERLVVLDAHTGEVRSEQRRPAGIEGNVRAIALTSRGFAMWTGPRELTGWDLDTGKATWTYSPPRGCVFSPDRSYAALQEVIAALLICGPDMDRQAAAPGWIGEERALTATVVGLDPGTGAQVWRHERTAITSPSEVSAYASADGSALAVTAKDQDVVLLQKTGKVLGRLDFDAVVDGWGRNLPTSTGFTAEGRLTATEPQGQTKAFRWEPMFKAAGQKEASVAWLGADEPMEALPLQNLLLATTVSEAGTLIVLAVPWGTGETELLEIPVELAPGEPTGWPGTVPLLPTPGAVAVVMGGAWTVTGLI
jgi:hypothetical protein